MIDTYGRWYEENDYSTYPEEKWCDYDRLAMWIRSEGYDPKTSMENLIDMIILFFDSPDIYNTGDYGTEFTIEGCKEYIRNSGGFAEFDYNV
jgi:hypothetical protein